MKTRIVPLLFLLTLGACSAESTGTPPPTAAKEGREETATIRNTENIGVSGNAIGDRVDSALDAAEKHDAETKEAIDSGGN